MKYQYYIKEKDKRQNVYTTYKCGDAVKEIYIEYTNIGPFKTIQAATQYLSDYGLRNSTYVIEVQMVIK